MPEAAFKIFLLSPAKLTGRRADILFNPKASFEIASRLRSDGAPIDEVFSFLSGLYFRGKITYAKHFTRPPEGVPGVQIISSDRGLLPSGTVLTLPDLLKSRNVPIDAREAKYLGTLKATAERIASRLPEVSEVVLLGSIGTPKYIQPLLEIFGMRLKFPSDFVGRGDMSRGGLLLRRVESNEELSYISFNGAVLHGKRPPKLEPKRKAPLL